MTFFWIIAFDTDDPPEAEDDRTIQRRGYGSDVQFIWEGELDGSTTEDVVKVLQEYKIRSALVRIRGKVTLDLVEDAIFENAVYRPTLILANKADLQTGDGLGMLVKIADPLEVISISARESSNLAELLGSRLFTLLDIVRAYTKEPGKEMSPKPIVLPMGAVVEDVAKRLHNKFLENFKFAKITRKDPHGRANKIQAGSNYELQDGDIVQFYT